MDAPVLVYNTEASSNGWVHYQFCVTLTKSWRFADLKLWMVEKGCKAPIFLAHFNEKDKDPKSRTGFLALQKYRNYCRKTVDKKGGSILGPAFTRGLSEDNKVVSQTRGKRTDLLSFVSYATEKKGVVDILEEAKVTPEELAFILAYKRLATRTLSASSASTHDLLNGSMNVSAQKSRSD